MGKIDRLSKFVDDEPILWKDRKRILGLPISFTRYSFDSNRFYLKVGFLNIKSDEVLLYRILDIRLSRSLFQRIFGVGSITLLTADKSNNEIIIKNIKKSDRVYKALSNIVEKERDEKRVLGKEMFGAASIDNDNDVDFSGPFN